MTRLLMIPLSLALATTAFAIPGLDGEEGASGSGDSGYGDERGDLPPSTGDEDVKDNYIVNGREALPEEYPEVVHVATEEGNCTGAVIDPDGLWVLTAAHCMTEETPQDGITVSVGPNVGAFTQTAQSVAWTRHDSWDDNGEPEQGKDIAVIELAEPLDVPHMLVNSAPMSESWRGLNVIITGYGKTATNLSDGGTKRVAETEISGIGEVDNPDNSEFVDQYFEYNGSQSTCQGDSGGPTLANVGTRYVQIGITSWGAVPCGSGSSGNIRVDKYIGWLTVRGVPHEPLDSSPPDFICSNRLDSESPTSTSLGVVDFTIRCQVVYNNRNELDNVRWQWGDGTSSDGLDVEHTYTTAGNFTIAMEASGVRDGEEWSHDVTRNSAVTACDVPEAGFEIEPVEGLTWQVANKTDVSTYGCITDLNWEVYDANGDMIEEYAGWEPEITFAEPGEYRIVQNVGGFAGESAAEVEIKVRRRVGSCNSVGTTTGLGAFGLLLGAALLRRRRREG